MQTKREWDVNKLPKQCIIHVVQSAYSVPWIKKQYSQILNEEMNKRLDDLLDKRN